MRGFRLASVLRARVAQENSARGAVLRARREAEEAAERVRRMDAAVDARPRLEGRNGMAVAATLWARQATAGELSAAIAVAGEMDARVDERAAELTAAATRRRMVEKLAERHARAESDAEQAAAELEVDDLTTSRSRGGTTKR
jgi:flagellar protein FliJ